MKERITELGERRRVTLVLWMEDGAAFEPVQPTWELSKAQEAPETGTCEAVPDGARWQLTAEIQPESRGDYRLTYQFGLGTEIIRRSIPIRVVWDDPQHHGGSGDAPDRLRRRTDPDRGHGGGALPLRVGCAGHEPDADGTAENFQNDRRRHVKWPVIPRT